MGTEFLGLLWISEHPPDTEKHPRCFKQPTRPIQTRTVFSEGTP